MASATARAPQPCNEEGRPTTERPTGIFVIHDKATDSTIAARIQYLTCRFGLTAERGALVAGLYFGEAAHV